MSMHGFLFHFQMLSLGANYVFLWNLLKHPMKIYCSHFSGWMSAAVWSRRRSHRFLSRIMKSLVSSWSKGTAWAWIFAHALLLSMSTNNTPGGALSEKKNEFKACSFYCLQRERERERERERDRQTETETERDRERQRKRTYTKVYRKVNRLLHYISYAHKLYKKYQ